MRPSDQYAEDDEKQPGDESKQPEKGHDLAHMTAPSKDQRLQALRPGNGQRTANVRTTGRSWVEAALPSTASELRNRVTSAALISTGCRLPWQMMSRRIHAT